jgi:glycine dehydrogenase subunit 1
VSQGTLAAIFEFQTMVCELTGMEVANASMYDGASAAAEACLLARGATRGERVLVAGGVSPRCRAVMETYLGGAGVGLELLTETGGRLDPGRLRAALTGAADVAAVVVQQPNFFGLLEPLDEIGTAVHELGANRPHLVAIADPLSLGLLTPPGACGANTVVGELQSLGIAPQYGGPTAGYFATQQKHIRRLPGRLVAETTDGQGRRGFTLTLQTREQHIRREKATSNICTNSALIALRATIFLALLGPRGLREAAEQTLQRSHHALERLLTIPGVERVHSGPFFREFVVALPVAAEELVQRIYDSRQILAGVPLSRFWPERERELLVAVTERRTRAEIEALVLSVREEMGA